MKISVIIIAGNEEKNIGDCLASVKWADEIIVVDSESADKTVDIAKKYTDKVYVQQWLGFAKQKEFAVSKTTNDWVLSLDADERITPALEEEIKNLTFECDGYKIGRDNYFIGKLITSCGWENDFHLRLFNKNKSKMTDRLVHEGFVTEGKVETLINKMVHYTYDSIESALGKINNYSTLTAEESFQKKSISGIGVFLHSLSAFLRFFISYKGYKDGIHGMVISFFNSITSMLAYSKIWEMRRKVRNEVTD